MRELEGKDEDEEAVENWDVIVKSREKLRGKEMGGTAELGN